MSDIAAGGPLPLPNDRSIEAMFARYGPRYRLYVSAAVMLGTISTILASTIVNVALPGVMGAFGVGQDQAQLLATGFLAANTSFMLLNSWLVETVGFRATYAIAVAIFLIASLAAPYSASFDMMVLCRIMQGCSAGLLQPLTMQIIFQVFPPERRGTAMGMFACGVVMAPAIGPSIGGLVVDEYGWRSVFYLAMPVSIIGLILGMIFLPDRVATGPRRRFDIIGFLLLITWNGLLLYGLSHGQRWGWLAMRTELVLICAGLSFAAFILWELKTDSPLLNPRLFTNRAFSASAAVSFVYGGAMFGSTYLVPLFAQTIQGYSATRAGMLLMPAGLLAAVVFLFAGRLADRIRGWPLVAGGMVIFGLSSSNMTGVHTDTPFWLLAGWVMLGRLGLGLTMPAMNSGALRALPPHWVGQGSGAVNFCRMMGAAFCTNLLSVRLERSTQIYAEALTAAQDGNAAMQEMVRLLSGIMREEGVPDGILLGGVYDYLGRVVWLQANMLGFRDAFEFVSTACFLAVLPAMLLRRKPSPPPE